MSTASHKEIVRRHFAESVDTGNADLLDEPWTEDCVIHRPEVPEPISGLENFKRAFGQILDPYTEFSATIHDLIAEGDQVARRLVTGRCTTENGRAVSVAMPSRGER
jgi:predicted ester cyclase